MYTEWRYKNKPDVEDINSELNMRRVKLLNQLETVQNQLKCEHNFIEISKFHITYGAEFVSVHCDRCNYRWS